MKIKIGKYTLCQHARATRPPHRKKSHRLSSWEGRPRPPTHQRRPINHLCPQAPPTRSYRPCCPPGSRNLGEKGLPSADRNNKATLLLTGPFRTAKSSAKDSVPPELKLQYAKYRRALRARRRIRPLRLEAEAYSCPPRRAGYRRFLAWILT